MKIFIVISALIALTCGASFMDKVPEAVREELYKKYMSMALEDRQSINNKIDEYLTMPGVQQEMLALKMHEKMKMVATLNEEERNALMQAHRDFAPFFRNMPAESRKIIHEKFQSMTPQERKEVIVKLQEKATRFANLPDPIKEKFYTKFQDMSEKMATMTAEERQVEFEKFRELKRDKLHRHYEDGAVAYKVEEAAEPIQAFGITLTEEEREILRTKFQSMTPEERRQMRLKMEHRHVDSNGEVARIPRPQP